MFRNASCALKGEQPTRFCTCGGRITVLCDSCVPAHEATLSGEIHCYEQLHYLDFAKSAGLDEFLRRKSQVLTASALANKLQKLEEQQYQETRLKAERMVQEYIGRLDLLHRCFRSLVERFHNEKQAPLSAEQPAVAAFTAAILNAGTVSVPDTTLLVEVEPTQHLEADMKAMNERMDNVKGIRNDFDEFYSSAISRCLNTPSVGVRNPQPPVDLRPDPVPQNACVRVPFSRGSQLAIWRSNKRDLKRIMLDPPLNFTNLTVSVVLPDGNMISIGGHGEHECRVVKIDTTSGKVSVLANMLTARANPGVVYASNMLFAFGGFCNGDKEHKSGEKYDFQRNKWTQLKNCMKNSRFRFSPFPHMRTVYLAGGWHTAVVEAFDIPNETFTPLPLVLPKPFASTCFVYNNELVVLQDHRLIRWPLNSTTGNSQSQTIGPSVKDSNVMVQILGTKAYFSCEIPIACEIFEVDLVNWEIDRVESLSPGLPNVGMPPCPVS